MVINTMVQSTELPTLASLYVARGNVIEL